MRGIRTICVLLVSLLSMTACLSRPTPVQGWSRNKRYEDIQRRTQREAVLISPTGRFEIPIRCYKEYPLYNVCTIHFSSQAVTDEYNQIVWSDDDQYAVLCSWFGGGCVRRTLAIWDMEAGRQVTFLSPDDLPSGDNPQFVWKSKAHELVIGYLNVDVAGAVEVDVAARTVKKLNVCPDWLDDNQELGWFCGRLTAQNGTVQP